MNGWDDINRNHSELSLTVKNGMIQPDGEAIKNPIGFDDFMAQAEAHGWAPVAKPASPDASIVLKKKK